ncbi:MAG: zinc carboxypeptidase [Candidatus Eremiobacteraeota bacterium]|nr:zinc carboxypeptidase [Candidatus Eremiobacteraeota bacterium]MCW5866153.1 zinc carboxypeptidase [Candidatus Eremiobacteraeota bacterium]
MMQITPRSSYFLGNADNAPVHPSRFAEAASIDSNRDGILQRDELVAHLEEAGGCCHQHHEKKADQEALLSELQLHLRKLPNPIAKGYHSYEQVNAELDKLSTQYPDLCQKVSLGRSAEGREIWALRLSSDAQEKTGVVITGCHHAREWMSVEIPLHVAKTILEGDRSRLEKGEIWIVPVVNPDGYEHSRNSDAWWRKNRRPVEVDAVGNKTDAIGVDLNRNYYDGVHMELYRPEGDTPGSTSDDWGATSDNPSSDSYRGPSGASEPETQAILGLELGHKNIRGVIDHHSYGEMILYPWGYTSEPSPVKDLHVEIGSKMNEAMGGRYSLKQSSGLYPSAGESDDCQSVNGLVTFTLEVGRSFQPNPTQIPATCQLVGKANLVFIDEILRRAEEGTLPERV